MGGTVLQTFTYNLYNVSEVECMKSIEEVRVTIGSYNISPKDYFINNLLKTKL